MLPASALVEPVLRVGRVLGRHGGRALMGEAKRYYEDVNEGDEAPVLRHTLERTDLVRYAGASGDYNPMHHDEVKAQAAGQPSVFGHGMFSMGLLGTALTDFLGVGNLTRYQVRFSRQTWPGEQLSTRIVVVGKRVEGGRHLVDVECILSNENGEEKVSGVATAELPSISAPKARPVPAKKAAVKKAAVKKAGAKKAGSAKKVSANKASPAKKAAVKKAAVKKAGPAKKVSKSPSAKKPAAKKPAAKKPAAKKPAAKKPAAKKAAVKKAAVKKATAVKKAVAK
jgi:acyl dehydratase